MHKYSSISIIKYFTKDKFRDAPNEHDLQVGWPICNGVVVVICTYI